MLKIFNRLHFTCAEVTRSAHSLFPDSCIDYDRSLLNFSTQSCPYLCLTGPLKRRFLRLILYARVLGSGRLPSAAFLSLRFRLGCAASIGEEQILFPISLLEMRARVLPLIFFYGKFGSIFRLRTCFLLWRLYSIWSLMFNVFPSYSART